MLRIKGAEAKRAFNAAAGKLSMKRIIETNSPEETMAIGEEMGRAAAPGEIVCLNGDLGTGKTVFTKGFARGLEIGDDVVSPTFTIVQEYHSGRLPMYHFDVYRIDDIDEMNEIGYEEYFFGDGVTLIEWSMLIAELIPTRVKKVLIEKAPELGDDFRRITITEPDF